MLISIYLCFISYTATISYCFWYRLILLEVLVGKPVHQDGSLRHHCVQRCSIIRATSSASRFSSLGWPSLISLPHWSRSELRFLPSTVLWSAWHSLARNLTLTLLQLIKDLKKVTNLLASITLRWKHCDTDSIRFLWVHLLMLNICLIVTFQLVYTFSHSEESKFQSPEP